MEAQFEGYIYTYENLRTVRELRATLDLNSVRFYATPPGAAAGANCSAAVSTLTVGLSDLYHRSYWGTTSVRHTEVSGSGLSPLRAACPPPAASELAALGLQLALVVPTRPPAESPLIGLRDGALLSVAGGDPRWAPVSLELGPVIGARVEHPSPNYAARTMFTQTAVIDGLSPLE
ncbi:MAG: hypothetical protein JNM72_24060 [Deltaproteobacteria bacterium]|nr:hypothetical protein [Deltaproteobacteria bacterium]